MRYAFESLQGAVASDAKTIVDGVGPYRPSKPKKEVNKNVVYAGAGVGGLVVLALLVWLLWPDAASPALLSITTNPEGAEVMVDDAYVDTTPLENHEVATDLDQIHVRIQKTGYVPVDTMLDVVAGEVLALNGLRLQEVEQVAMLTITSTPGGARVYVNERPQGETGAMGALDPIEVPAGEVIVRVEKDGFKTQTDTLQVQPGQSLSYTPMLASLEGPIDNDNRTTPNDNTPRTGTLTVNIGSGNGTIRVRDESCQDGQPCTVGAGTKQVSCGSETFSVTVPAGGRESITCYFEHKIIVQVRKDGNPFWGSIAINGDEVEKAMDQTVTRGPGTYTISVTREGFTVEPSMQSITLKPALERKTEKVVFHLQAQ
jgi:hypothetical protein